MRVLAKLLMLLSLVCLTGCVAPRKIPGASHDLLRFLQNGQTTRQEVLLTLGQPSAVFEEQKILTYRIGDSKEQGLYLITPNHMRWASVRYSLVLVFDPNGILLKNSMVSVN